MDVNLKSKSCSWIIGSVNFAYSIIGCVLLAGNEKTRPNSVLSRIIESVIPWSGNVWAKHKL